MSVVENVEKVPSSVKLDSEKVVVKGFIVVYKVPSQNLLKAFLPKLFKDVRIGIEEIKIVNGFFYNKISYLANKFYDILNKYTIDLGFARILPAENVNEFLRAVSDLEDEYAEYQRMFEEFIYEGKIPTNVRKDAKFDEEYIAVVMEYLRQHGIEKIKVPNIASRFKVRIIPFALDTNLLIDYIDEKTREQVEEQINILTKEIVAETEEKIRNMVEDIIERLKKYQNKKLTKRVLKKLKEDVDSIEKSLSLIGADTSRVDALREVLRDIEEGRPVTEEHIENVRVMALKEFLS